MGEGGLTARALLPACRGACLRLQTVQHQGGLGGCRGSPPVWSWQLRVVLAAAKSRVDRAVCLEYFSKCI